MCKGIKMLDIKAVDLFCGVGGLTYGLQQAGIKVVAGIDLDASCEYAYSHNNKTLFIRKSVEEVTAKEIKALLKGAAVKVLVGCAPCQPFSNHQKDKQNRSKHKAWNLLFQFARLVREVKPHIVSMENVPELEKEEVFEDFLQTLLELDYSVSYKVVNVAEYGVPQRRRRLILLASKIKDHIEIIPPFNHKKVTVRDVLEKLPSIEAGKACLSDALHVSARLSSLNLQRIKASVPGGTWRDWPQTLRLKCHQKEKGKSYGSVYGRMCWDDVAPTITTQFIGYGTGRFGHPEQNRAITLREGALLQSFPLHYEFIAPGQDLKLREVARHIGNAVPPRLGGIIGLSIVKNVSPKRFKELSQALAF